MTDVAFYNLQRSPLEAVLARLLERTLAERKRAVVIAGSEERVEALAGALWTYRPDSWLPHGTAQDGHPEDQPVWLTARDENPNGASYLILTDGADSQHLDTFERCLDLFDGNDRAAVEAARARWAERKSAGHSLTYWQQTDRGSWQRKA
jgi:DNA polymerase-3 subunit chi